MSAEHGKGGKLPVCVWVETPQGSKLSYRQHQEGHKQTGKSMRHDVWGLLEEGRGLKRREEKRSWGTQHYFREQVD